MSMIFTRFKSVQDDLRKFADALDVTVPTVPNQALHERFTRVSGALASDIRRFCTRAADAYEPVDLSQALQRLRESLSRARVLADLAGHDALSEEATRLIYALI